jgi:hypothetical protein
MLLPLSCCGARYASDVVLKFYTIAIKIKGVTPPSIVDEGYAFGDPSVLSGFGLDEGSADEHPGPFAL